MNTKKIDPISAIAGNAKEIATLSAAALAGTTSAQAVINTNIDLGLSGFTSSGWFFTSNGAYNPGQAFWNIDNAGPDEAVIFTSRNSIHPLQPISNDFMFRSSGSALLNLGYGAGVSSGAFNSNRASIMAHGYFLGGIGTNGFISGEAAYIGFKFNPSGSLDLYGWAEIIITEGARQGTIEVVQWAYEDSGANIQTGAIPEPETAPLGLGLLALGAAGLRRSRKSRHSN